MYSDDPVADFLAYDSKRHEKEKKLPVCEWCGEPIYDDFLYDISGELVCQDCIDNCRKNTDDFIGE